MFFHTEGLVLLLNFSSQERVGTRIILRTKVEKIPITSVIPTERIGDMGTIAGAMSTENPTIVVSAERNTATPVERVISMTQDL